MAPLEVDDLVEPAGDVGADTRELVAFELLPAPTGDALEEPAQALDRPPVRAPQPRLQGAAEGGVEVAVVEEVVRQPPQHLVGVELEPLLAAVPAAVDARLHDRA